MSQTTEIHFDLVERCKEGDSRAQYELYELYSSAMYNVSLRILNNGPEAEDVLQECFVSAFTKMDTFRGESSFGSWLKRIVVNRSINSLKKKKLPLEDIDERIHGQEADGEPEEHEEPEYTVEDVKWAMGELSEGYRVVFSLFMFEDWSHREIADSLGISESTSKSQLNRAKKRVKELIIQRHER